MSPQVRRLLVAALVIAAALWLGSRSGGDAVPADELGDAVAATSLVAVDRGVDAGR